jgi:hypothetical protein
VPPKRHWRHWIVDAAGPLTWSGPERSPAGAATTRISHSARGGRPSSTPDKELDRLMASPKSGAAPLGQEEGRRANTIETASSQAVGHRRVAEPAQIPNATAVRLQDSGPAYPAAMR